MEASCIWMYLYRVTCSLLALIPLLTSASLGVGVSIDDFISSERVRYLNDFSIALDESLRYLPCDDGLLNWAAG